MFSTTVSVKYTMLENENSKVWNDLDMNSLIEFLAPFKRTLTHKNEIGTVYCINYGQKKLITCECIQPGQTRCLIDQSILWNS